MEMGIVKHQLMAMVLATPQLTDAFPVLPAPIIDPDTACVVLRGKPKKDAVKIIIAELNSAETPLAGLS